MTNETKSRFLEKINEINRSWSYSSKIRGGGEEKTQVNKIRK